VRLESFRQHYNTERPHSSLGYRWPLEFKRAWEQAQAKADMSGLPCGKKAAFATRGYFARQRNRQGRQLGRVLASYYDEVVVDRVFAGATQLVRALPALMLAAEQTLDLDVAKRALMAVGPRRSSDGQGLFQYACGTLGRERGALGRRPAYRGPPNRLRDDRGNRVYSTGRADRGALSQVQWVVGHRGVDLDDRPVEDCDPDGVVAQRMGAS
jgi:hypothetical protein